MKTVLATLACIALLHCHDSIQSPDLSDQRMTDGTVLDVTPGGDVRIGAKASLIITANDGMVYVRGPFAVGNDLIVRDGIVTIKHLEQADAREQPGESKNWNPESPNWRAVWPRWKSRLWPIDSCLPGRAVTIEPIE